MAEWLVWTTGCRRRSLCAVGEGGCVNRRTGSRLVDLENPPLQQTHTHTHTRCAPCRALMADYVNEEDQPEDQTSFNPETELNNTDATCAFKCLFEGLIVLSRGFFFLLSFHPSPSSPPPPPVKVPGVFSRQVSAGRLSYVTRVLTSPWAS